MSSRNLTIGLISLSAVLFFVIAYSINYENNSSIENSTKKQAQIMFEKTGNSPSAALLSSEVFQKDELNTNDKVDRTKLSYLNIFNDKLDLPQSQLAIMLDQLNSEHQMIIAQYNKFGKSIDKTLELTPSYRVVLATFCNKSPGSFTFKDLNEFNLNSKDLFFLKRFSESNDFKLLLRRNQLDKEYLKISNLKKIYGESHHKEGINREVSNTDS